LQKAGQFEEQIRESLREATDQVEASDLLRGRIRRALWINQKEDSMKKVLVLAAVVCCFVTATVFAAGTISSYVSVSSANPTYTTIPSDKKLNKDLGFSSKIPESFSNGFSFKEASISETAGKDDTGTDICKFKEMYTHYVSAEGQQVTLVSNLAKYESQDSADKVLQTETEKGTVLQYSSQLYKFVPPDYQLTPEDQVAQDNGSVTFSYGSEKVETSTFQFVRWTEGEVSYMLMAQNTQLSAEDLFGMAKEVIGMQ